MIKNNTVAFSCLKDECQEGIKGSEHIDTAFFMPFAKGFFGIIVLLERHVVFRNKCAMTYFRQEIEGEAK